MRAVNHRFVLQLRIAAGDQPHHVARVQLAQVGNHLAVDLYSQVDRPEAGLFGCGQQLVHRFARQAQQPFAGLARQPAGAGKRALAGGQLHVGKLARPGAAHHLPAVTGGRRGVDDEDGPRAAPQPFLVFVDPAAIVSERGAIEEFRIVGSGFVGEEHQHLAGHVHAFEIVPVPFRRRDAVADEDRVRVEGRAVALAHVDAHQVVEQLEIDLLAAGRRGDLRLGLRGDAHQRHLLEVGAILARRFGAGRRQLPRDVFRGQVAAPGSHAAAFQQVARKILHVFANMLRVDGPRLRRERAAEPKRQAKACPTNRQADRFLHSCYAIARVVACNIGGAGASACQLRTVLLMS